MSSVTDIYTKIETNLAATFSSKTVIPNPISVSDNNDNILMDGQGFFMGASSESDIDFPTYQVYQRDIHIILTRHVYRQDNDLSELGTAQKQLFEDQNTLLVALARDSDLCTSIIRGEFTGDSGIEFVYDGKFGHLKLQTTFVVHYKEDLTYSV